MVSELINANPTVYEKKERRARSAPNDDADEYAVEPIDQPEVFDILSLEFFFFFLVFNWAYYCIRILRLCFCWMELGFGIWDWIGDVFYCFQVVLRSCLLSYWGCLCHMEFLCSRFGLFWEGYAMLGS